jgi:hypothetical protein
MVPTPWSVCDTSLNAELDRLWSSIMEGGHVRLASSNALGYIFWFAVVTPCTKQRRRSPNAAEDRGTESSDETK